MTRVLRVVTARLRAVFRREAPNLRQGSVALVISTGAGFLAGITLGALSGTLERLPGLLMLVPPVLALRGNIGGALASRLATAIHAGTFRRSWRIEGLMGQNLAAATALSLILSLAFAVVAKPAAIVFGIENSISLADFVTISVVGGALASAVVIALTVAMAILSARRNWDLDNVAAPVVTTAGDIATLPSLWLATHLVEIPWVTPAVAVFCTVATVVSGTAALRTRLPILRGIVRQSLPVLAVTGLVSIAAGVSVERQVETLVIFPVIFVLLPPFLDAGGSVGGIFAARVATKLHLGTVDARRFRFIAIAEDLFLVACFAFPVFLALGAVAHGVGVVAGMASPGLVEMIQICLIAGSLATTGLLAIGYSVTVLTYRVGLDPDNYAIPTVTSSLDLLGAVSIILALALVGVI